MGEGNHQEFSLEDILEEQRRQRAKQSVEEPPEELPQEAPPEAEQEPAQQRQDQNPQHGGTCLLYTSSHNLVSFPFSIKCSLS